MFKRRSPRHVAAAIVQRPDGKVLLLKRSPHHRTNAGKWSFVTGYVDRGEAPREAAIRELREELGIKGTPTRAGEVVVVEFNGRTLYIHPFLFAVGEVDIQLEREHTAYTWIEPGEVYDYDTVPQIDEDLIGVGLLSGG
jgi:8-oxo-dGTP pyrophosphatase MutT (NUDIX family)